MEEENTTEILPRHPTSSINVEQTDTGEIRCTDGRFAPEFREQSHTPREWEQILERHLLCLECDEAFIHFPWAKGATCWRCNATYDLVDDSHGHGPYAVLVKLVGQDDEDARYIVGENLAGWALAEWAGGDTLPEGHLADRFWGV